MLKDHPDLKYMIYIDIQAHPSQFYACTKNAQNDAKNEVAHTSKYHRPGLPRGVPESSACSRDLKKQYSLTSEGCLELKAPNADAKGLTKMQCIFQLMHIDVH